MRNWSFARVITLGIGWMVILFVITAIRSSVQSAEARRQYPETEVHVMARVPGGRWFLLGPPVLLLFIGFLIRASRRT